MKPVYTGPPALLIGRAGRRLLRQQESLRRPGSSAPVNSGARVSRRGRGFRPPNFAPPSLPCVREPSPPPAPKPPRHELLHPSYLQIACVTAPPPLLTARVQQMATLPSYRAGSSRPGCWNCGCFGHSWVDCHQPRMRFCRMCGHHGCTIATCPSCCDEWGRRRLQELEEERLQLEEPCRPTNSNMFFFSFFVLYYKLYCTKTFT